MKRVLLFAPDWINLISCFEKNLQFCGFSVTTLNQDIPPFRYQNPGQKIYNFFRKTFWNDRTYKQGLREEHFLRHRLKTADIKKRFDYALIIRADFLSIKELDLIKSVADQMISFHFDGMHRYPKIFRRIAHFDRFFVFDPEDAQKYAYNNVRFMPNCYFDYPESGGKGICPTPGYQLYYLGSFEALRTKEILRLQQYLAKMGFNHKIDLVFDQANRRHITPELEAAVTCLTETISFEAHQQRIERTNILLDFALDQHTGLSYRIFESIKYEKKLITTNVHVVNYDFYTPENIFILNDNYSELYDFIETPYTALPSQIKKKYSFTSWIKNIFNDPPLEDINLIAPKKVSDKTIRVPAAKF